MVNLAICGLGRIGTFHLENLRTLRGCQVSCACDVRPDACAKAATQYGIQTFDTLESMCGDPTIDAVVIATPSNNHRAALETVLRHGKHAFVEKPLAGTAEDARAMVAMARQSDRCVQAGFCERFNAHYIEARRAVQSGALGPLRLMHSSRVAPWDMSDPMWELGVFDTAVHNFDLLLWLKGQMPETVRAFGAQIYPDTPGIHAATTILRFADGALATDQITWIRDARHPLSQCARSRMLLTGERGIFEVDLSRRSASLLTDADYRMCDTVILGGPEYYGCLRLQFEAFLRSIEDAMPVQAPLDDAWKAECVALAAFDSVRSGKEIRLADIYGLG